jgi:hypothetical protein
MFPVRLDFSTADLADLVDGQIEERGQPFAPLVEPLGSMHENQSICFPRCDQIRRSYGFAEGRSDLIWCCFSKNTP